jgi:hypothetical protein
MPGQNALVHEAASSHSSMPSLVDSERYIARHVPDRTSSQSNIPSVSSFSLTLTPTPSMLANQYATNMELDYMEDDLDSIDSAGARPESSTFTY